MVRVHVDGRFRTPDSESGSDFTIELLEPLQLPAQCRCKVTNMVVPFSWYSFEQGNRLLYFSEKQPDNSEEYRVADIPVGQYDGPRFATSLQAAMNAASTLQAPYTVAYSDRTGQITIQTTAQAPFTLYSDLSLRAFNPWPFGAFSTAGTALQPRSINRNLRLAATATYAFLQPYVSEFVDLLGNKALYLTSNSLGQLSNVGPRIGQTNCLCSVAVTSSFGFVNVQEATAGEQQDFDCSGQLLKRLSFRLEDAFGVTIPLHGLDISFTLSFEAR